jgi:hypothetical protein
MPVETAQSRCAGSPDPAQSFLVLLGFVLKICAHQLKSVAEHGFIIVPLCGIFLCAPLRPLWFRVLVWITLSWLGRMLVENSTKLLRGLNA